MKVVIPIKNAEAKPLTMAWTIAQKNATVINGNVNLSTAVVPPKTKMGLS